MKKIKLIFLLCLPGLAYSNGEAWRPDPKFQLENADYMQTLSWVSGVSYTLSKYQREHQFLCNGPESVGSKEIIDYLNGTHAGEMITSEQAIETIFNKLEQSYPCNGE